MSAWGGKRNMTKPLPRVGSKHSASANASSTVARYPGRVNASALGLEPGLPSEPFKAATARVNEWRGHTIHAFTRGETAVTDCLVALAEVKGRGSRISLPHLAGQRLEALSTAIRSGGPFEAEGGAAVPVLEEFRAQMELRNMLCHGAAQVTLDSKGRWTVVLRLVTFRSQRACREALVLTEAEAEEKRDRISRLSHQLCDRLAQTRSSLS